MKNITNCPNCGAPLDITGRCSYCGTNVKIAKTLDVTEMQDICLIMRNPKDYKDVTVLPLRGRVSELTFKLTDNERAEVSYYFDGVVVTEEDTNDFSR